MKGQKQPEDTVVGFLEGMYYATKLPSRAECRLLARYMHARGLVGGTPGEVEKRVTDAMDVLHKSLDQKFAESQEHGQEGA